MNVYRLTNLDDEIVGTIVEFDNGKVVTSWETEGMPQSLAVWDSMSDAAEIHVGNGNRQIVTIAFIA